MTPPGDVNHTLPQVGVPTGFGKNISRSTRLIAGAMIVSRILGFVREQVFAAFFGAGFLFDAYQVGLRVTSPLYDLLSTGTLPPLVTAFTHSFEKRGTKETWRLAGNLMSLVATAMAGAAALGVVFAPTLVSVLAPGFSPAKAALASNLTRIMFPVILPVALASVAVGLLNSRERFITTAFATTAHNLGLIFGGLAFAHWLAGGPWLTSAGPDQVPGAAGQGAITGMALGVLLGGTLQLMLQIPALARMGFRARPRLSVKDPGVRQVVRLLLPAMIGTLAVQLNLLINTFFASGIAGGPSWLGFAHRLSQLPVGILGASIGTAALPLAVRAAARGEHENFASTVFSSLKIALLLLAPAACALFLLARPITALVYERGAFTAVDTEMVAAALRALSVGIVGSAATHILLPSFYALDDVRPPVVISLCSVALNVVASGSLGALFSRVGVTPSNPAGYTHAGIALASSCASLFTFLAAAYWLSRRSADFRLRPLLFYCLRLAPAVLAFLAAAYVARHFLKPPGRGTFQLILSVGLPLAAGGAAFALLAAAFGLGGSLGLLRRRSKTSR